LKILVAGIGNIFQGDDAFGCEVARALAARPLPPDVRVVDFGIRGLDLTYALLDRPDLTILLDTVQRGGAPGDLYTIEPELDKLDQSAPASIDTHAMDPVRVLRMAQALAGEESTGSEPAAPLGRILLVGCEPADLGGEDGRMGLTPPVADAVERAAAITQSLIEKQIFQEATTT
jgi:hydrogenase maturation protease